MATTKKMQKGAKQSKSGASQSFTDFMAELNKSVDFEMGSLFVMEEDSCTLKQVATKGEGIDFINRVNFPMGKGLSAWVAQKGKPVYLPDIHRGSRHGLNPIRSYLSIPLEVNNKTIGVLNLGHVVPNAFDKKAVARIEALSKDMTRKIYNRTFLNYSL
jgi:GAF domain-containing protein